LFVHFCGVFVFWRFFFCFVFIVVFFVLFFLCFSFFYFVLCSIRVFPIRQRRVSQKWDCTFYFCIFFSLFDEIHFIITGIYLFQTTKNLLIPTNKVVLKNLYFCYELKYDECNAQISPGHFSVIVFIFIFLLLFIFFYLLIANKCMIFLTRCTFHRVDMNVEFKQAFLKWYSFGTKRWIYVYRLIIYISHLYNPWYSILFHLYYVSVRNLFPMVWI
jgi:hypothetical protein